MKRYKQVFRWLLLAMLLCSGALLAGVLLWNGKHAAPAETTVAAKNISPAATDSPEPPQASQASTPQPESATDCITAADPEACLAKLHKANPALGALVAGAVHAALPVPVESLDCSKAADPEACLLHQQGSQAKPVQSASETVTEAKNTSPSQTAVSPTKTKNAPSAASTPAATKTQLPTHPAGADLAKALTAKLAQAPATPAATKAKSAADAQYDAAVKACEMAPNPDECLRKLVEAQQRGTPVDFNISNYPLTSEMLGMSGPLSFVVRYDADMSVILGVDYVQMFNERFGVSTKLTLGAKERRANLTTGFAISPDQQVKMTYEYLAQKQNFDFESGAVEEWVDQHAVGAAYQYLIRHEIVHSLEVSGYTVRANSKDLSSVAFNQTGNEYDVNFRRIAGGTENTMLAALNLLPLKDTALTVGAGYSSLSYDTKYEASPSTSGLSYKIDMTHVLTPKTKINASINAVASGREHGVQISHILPNNVEVSIKGQYIAASAGLPDSKNVALNFTYPAPSHYSVGSFANGLQELRNWIEKPVVYKERVLAIKDEMVQRYGFTSSNPPDQTKSNSPTASNQDRTVDSVQTKDYFQFTDPDLKVTYAVTIKYPDGHTDMNLSTLSLELVSSGNQAVLQATGFIPSTTDVGAYLITITGTGTRAGISPVTSTAQFTVNVITGDVVWDTKFGSIIFATTPSINSVVGKTCSQNGIVLKLKDANGNPVNPTNVTWVNNNKPTYWTLQQDGAQWCLMRDTSTSDLSGNLSAAEIGGSAVNLNLCGYDAQTPTQCIPGTVAATVTGDSSTGTGGVSAVIGALIPTPYQVKAGAGFNDWDGTTANGLSSVYILPPNTTPATVPIVGDAYTINSWSDAQIPTAGNPTAWPLVTISAAGIMSGTAPSGSVAIGTYDGTFQVGSAKAAAGNKAVTNFDVQVEQGDPPNVQSITGKLRYSLTTTQNSASATDPGLNPQSGYDYNASDSSRQLIDLNSMVINANQVADLDFTFTDGQKSMTLWRIIQGNSAWGGNPSHWYLFRDFNANGHLEAGDVNTSTNPPISICVTGNGYPADCSKSVTVNITAETNPGYATVVIPDFAQSQPSFSYAGASNVATSALPPPNALSKTVSLFLGQSSQMNPIAIDNDARSVVKPPEMDTVVSTGGAPTWNNTDYLITDGLLPTGGVLTGTAPTVSSNSLYTSTFTANSAAKGTNVSDVRFISEVTPAIAPNFTVAAVTTRFDLTNGSADSGLQAASANELSTLDMSTNVSNAGPGQAIPYSNLQFSFANSQCASIGTKVAHWQLVVADGTSSNVPNGKAGHTYLFRDLNSSGHLDASDINTASPNLTPFYIRVVNTANPTAAVCQTLNNSNVTVTGDNLTTSGGQQYIQAVIPNYVDNNQTLSFSTAGGSIINDEVPTWNALALTVSRFVGENNSKILIDGDILKVNSNLATDQSTLPVWLDTNYTITTGGLPAGGILSGTAPSSVTINTNYDSNFTVNSIAASKNAGSATINNPVHFITLLLPDGTAPINFPDMTVNSRFDMTNGLQDSGLQPTNSAEAIDITQNVLTASSGIQLTDLASICFEGSSNCTASGDSSGNWQLVKLTSNTSWGGIADHTYLFRNLVGGHLQAGDIGTTPSLKIRVTATNSEVVTGTVDATVIGDSVNDIRGTLSSYSADGGAAITWQTANGNGTFTAGYYYNNGASNITIDGETYSNWPTSATTVPMGGATPSTPDWGQNGGVLTAIVDSISSSDVVMNGTAPIVDSTADYTGLLKPNSKAAANRAVDVHFPATINPASQPIFPPNNNGEIRFDLTNGLADTGLQPQDGDTVIDVTAMVTNASSIPNLLLCFNSNPSAGNCKTNFQDTTGLWQLVTMGANNWGGAVGHVYLFRDLNSSGNLDATSVNSVVPVTVYTKNPANNTVVSGVIQVTVKPDTLQTNAGQQYVQVVIPNYVDNNKAVSFSTAGSTNLSTLVPTWNALVPTISRFVGENGSKLQIDGDTRTVTSELTTTKQDQSAPDWDNSNYLIAMGDLPSGGALTGVSPSNATTSNFNYDSAFFARSVAAGGVNITNPVHFITLLEPDTVIPINFSPMNVDSRFDMTNGSQDRGLQPKGGSSGSPSTQAIDITRHLIIENPKLSNFIETYTICFQSGSSCTVSSDNKWQLITASSDDANAWGAVVGHIYLFRNLINGNLQAGDINETPKLQIRVSDPADALHFVDGTINATVTGDADNNIRGVIATPFTAVGGSAITNWATQSNPITAGYYYGSGTPQASITIDDEVYSQWPSTDSPVTIDQLEWAQNSGTLNYKVDSGSANNAVMTGTAPVIGSNTTYTSTNSLQPVSKAAAGRQVGVSFTANITAAEQPNFTPSAAEIRFDLTNDGLADNGLQPQGAEPVIDITSMVTNANKIPNLLVCLNPEATSSSNCHTKPDPQGLWQLVTATANDSWGTEGHTYLFRDLNSNNHLDATAVNSTVPVDLYLVNPDNTLGAVPATLSVAVKPDTLKTSSNQQYIQIVITDYVDNNQTPSFSAPSGSTIGAAPFDWNVLALEQTISRFVGKSSSKIQIDGDTRAVTSDLATDQSTSPTWPDANYTIATGTLTAGGGVLSGKAPTGVQVDTTSTYTSRFTASSVAAGSVDITNPVYFATLLTPDNTPPINFPDMNVSTRFDLTNGAQDSGLQPQSGELIDITQHVLDASPGIALADLAICFTYDVGTKTCTLTSNDDPGKNWQLIVADSTSSNVAGGTAGHTYLFRNLVGGHLQAGDITTTPGLSIRAVDTATGGIVTGTVNATVNGDSLTINKDKILGRVPAPGYTAVSAGPIPTNSQNPWSTANPAGGTLIVSSYDYSSDSLIIDNETYTWSSTSTSVPMTGTNGAPDWASKGGILNVVASGSDAAMTGTAPLLGDTDASYTGTLAPISKAAAGGVVNVTFPATITHASSPDIVVPTDPQPIRFDLTSNSSGQDTGLTRMGSEPVIDVTSMVSNADAIPGLLICFNETVTSSSDCQAKPTTPGLWQLVTATTGNTWNGTVGHVYLFRDFNSSGNLDATQIGATGLTVTVYAKNPANSSLAVSGDIPVTVTPDTFNNIGGKISQAFTAISGATISNWSTVGLIKAYYYYGAGASIQIDGEVYSGWPDPLQPALVPMSVDSTSTPSAPDWAAAGGVLKVAAIAIGSNDAVMNGTAPIVNAGSDYIGVLPPTSKAAGRGVNVTFPAQIGTAVAPQFDGQPFALRFDLINSTLDKGLQASDSTDELTAIDLTTHISNAGIGKDIPDSNLQFSFADGQCTPTSAPTNWQLVVADSTSSNVHNGTPGHTYLFRALNGSGHLDANDITPASPGTFYIRAVNSANPTQPTCQEMSSNNVTVNPDSTNDIHGQITGPFTTISGDAVSWTASLISGVNIAPIVASYYYNSGNSTITIDNEAYTWPASQTVNLTSATPNWSLTAQPDTNVNNVVMTGTAPSVNDTTTYADTIVSTATSRAAAKAVNVKFDAVVNPSNGILKVCTDPNDPNNPSGECAIRFDRVDVNANDPTAPNLINVSALVNTTLYPDYQNAQIKVDPSFTANWKTAQNNGTGPWYLVRNASSGNNPNTIDATDVNQPPVVVPLIVAKSDGSNPVPASVTVQVLPDPNLIYVYTGTTPIKLRVIDDPAGVNYANDVQPGVSINWAITTQAYSPINSSCNYNVGSPAVPVGCKVVGDSVYTFGFSGSTPSYAQVSGTNNQYINFTYGNLTKANNWITTLTDFVPTARSTANGNANKNISSPPAIQVSDLEIVARSGTPVPYARTSSSNTTNANSCPAPTPAGPNQCLYPYNDPTTNWRVYSIVNIDVSKATLNDRTKLQIVQYQANYPSGTDITSYRRNLYSGKVLNAPDIFNSTSASLSKNPFPSTDTNPPITFPVNPSGGYVAFTADYSRSGSSGDATQEGTYATYLSSSDQTAQHTSNIVIRYTGTIQ